MTYEERDAYRARWRRFREPLHLVDLEDERFGRGGLAGRLDRPTMRLVILPGDPDRNVLEFDEEFWEWFRQDQDDPASEGSSNWGSSSRPTSSAAVRSNARNASCSRYLAVHRNGAFELGLGNDARYPLRPSITGVRLITIVGRVWCALEQYRQVIERFDIDGPWEIHASMIDVNDTVLGLLAEGWMEPYDNGGRQCTEENLMYVTELDDWPDPDRVRSVAFKIGGWIEDSWGNEMRRFLARGGSYDGRFDASRYNW